MSIKSETREALQWENKFGMDGISTIEFLAQDNISHGYSYEYLQKTTKIFNKFPELARHLWELELKNQGKAESSLVMGPLPEETEKPKEKAKGLSDYDYVLARATIDGKKFKQKIAKEWQDIVNTCSDLQKAENLTKQQLDQRDAVQNLCELYDQLFHYDINNDDDLKYAQWLYNKGKFRTEAELIKLQEDYDYYKAAKDTNFFRILKSKLNIYNTFEDFPMKFFSAGVASIIPDALFTLIYLTSTPWEKRSMFPIILFIIIAFFALYYPVNKFLHNFFLKRVYKVCDRYNVKYRYISDLTNEYSDFYNNGIKIAVKSAVLSSFLRHIWR